MVPACRYILFEQKVYLFVTCQTDVSALKKTGTIGLKVFCHSIKNFISLASRQTRMVV
jgi:hypothetical protein